MITRETRDAANDWWNAREEARYLYGFIGKPLGNGEFEIDVPGSPGMVYVRIANTEGNETTLSKAVNFGALPNPRMLVRMKRIAGDLVIEEPVPYSALKLYGSYTSAAATAPTINNIGSGSEDLVEDRRFMPGTVFPSASGGMLVTIWEFDYPGGHWSAADIDLTAYVPSTASKKRWVLVGVDAATGEAFARAGADVSIGDTLTKSSLPDILYSETEMPRGAFVLTNGQTKASASEKIVDARIWGTGVQGLNKATQIFNARMSLSSDDPAPLSGITAATMLYIDPYEGDRVGLHDGYKWEVHSLSGYLSGEIPSYPNTNYDVFLYESGGELLVETLAWTDDTNRATALATQDGVYVQDGDTTKRYIGSLRTTDTSGETEDSETKRYVWNYYNRLGRTLKISDSTSHTYSGTWRAWNNSSAEVAFIMGLPEEDLMVEVIAAIQAGVLNDSGAVSVGLNDSGAADVEAIENGNTGIIKAGVRGPVTPQTGYNFLQITESGDADTAPTFSQAEANALLKA